MKKDVCVKCKKPCDVYIDVDILQGFPRVETLSKCCSAHVVNTEIDEVDTPGGHLPYQGGGE